MKKKIVLIIVGGIIVGFTNVSYSLGSYVITANITGNENYTSDNKTIYLNLEWVDLNWSYSTNISSFALNISTPDDDNLTPTNQTDAIGVFNITLTSESQASDLYWRKNQSTGCADIYLGNSSGRSLATNLTTSYQKLYNNLTAGSDQMFWCWIDLNSCNIGEWFNFEFELEGTALGGYIPI